MVTSSKKGRNREQRETNELFERQIGRRLIDIFRSAPEELWAYFPGIADEIDKHLTPKKSSREKKSSFYSYLTEREREFRLDSLKAIVDRFRGFGNVSHEEAIKAIEDVAALQEYADEFKETVVTIASKTLKLSLNNDEKQTIYILKGKSEHHSYKLIRGINLALTWDGKLIKIEIDPDELSKRRKTLDFIGAGSDVETDVADKHDSYLGDAVHA